MNYKMLLGQLQALTEDCPYRISNLSNAAALLYDQLEKINWAGFYILRGEHLILGPFQGKTACVDISVGSGVCGTAVRENKVQRVENVHAFPGHIACDSASNSEIVLPIYVRGSIWGVLDIDSPELSRFTREDQQGLEEFSKMISAMLDRCRD